MLHEYRDIISKLKLENAHFAKIFERHNELDQKITDADEGRLHISDTELETMKKEKLNFPFSNLYIIWIFSSVNSVLYKSQIYKYLAKEC